MPPNLGRRATEIILSKISKIIGKGIKKDMINTHNLNMMLLINLINIMLINKNTNVMLRMLII